MNTNASDLQLGVVISKNVKPIAFCGIKLTGSQMRYTVTEKEPLSIVETLKKIRTISLGKILKIYTDNKNLTCNF